jgi:trans-aconitate methyltransferase
MPSAQVWSPDDYAKHGHFVPALGEAVVDLLAPRAGERILDVGCGDGVLTLKLVERGALAVGIDASEPLLGAARARGLDVHLADAQALAFHAEFDAVFSNAAIHWMPDTDAVLAGVRRALRPGGRFAGEFGGQGNCAAICTALLAVRRAHGFPVSARLPWYFPSAEAFAEKLAAHGFSIDSITLIPRPTALPTDMRGWLDTFANPFFADVAAGERATMLDEACALLAPSLRDERGAWTADYVRLRFSAHV